MALYLIRSHSTPDKRDEVFRRYAETDAGQAPEGITELGTWAPIGGDGAYHLVEADSHAAVSEWLLAWTDVCTYEVEPVLTGEEMVETWRRQGLVK